MAYDLIVVGCGNGACGFLAKYLRDPRTKSQRILILEEGRDFFDVSDIAHENNWIKSFSESNVFKLRHALTKSGTPIITARGCCLGGGGSINFTMISESSQWLADNIGRTALYWDGLKRELNGVFDLDPPGDSFLTRHVLNVTQQNGFSLNEDTQEFVPNFTKGRLSHRFPTPFNRFGQRTRSGMSIVDFDAPSVELRTRVRVSYLEFEKSTAGARCTTIHARDLDKLKKVKFSLKTGGKVVLCAGSTTPQILQRHNDTLKNDAIGQNVSDHILMPLGLYILDDDTPLVGKDVYLPVFATGEWTSPSSERVEYGFDFHAGVLDRLWFMLAHLFLAFVFPNSFKRLLVRNELVFRIVTNGIRILLQVITWFTFIFGGMFNILRGRPWNTRLKLITATLKFRPASKGRYVKGSDQIELEWFAKDNDGFCQDEALAKAALSGNMTMLNTLGTKPPWIVRKLLWLLVRMPYSVSDGLDYVDEYRQRFLLSQLHLSGGCDYGTVVERGNDIAMNTGRVKGSDNLYVADLSTVPLPRVSPQMTAYLIGYHVATALTSSGET